MTDYEDAVTRVANGVAWLDRTTPGWPILVDLETLELTNSDQCIAGQVFRHQAETSHIARTGYSLLMALYGAQWCVDHGFAGPWSEVREQWIAVIEARFSEVYRGVQVPQTVV